MGFYQSKPEVREALQWTGYNYIDLVLWCGLAYIGKIPDQALVHLGDDSEIFIWVEHSQSYCQVLKGGWVIKEPDGNGVYPNTEEDFARIYTPVKPYTSEDV